MKTFGLILAVLAFATLLADCGEPATSVSGSVLGPDGKPVEGVSVVMESQVAGGFRKESEQVTGPGGDYNFVTITGSAKNVRLSFSKDGFKDIQKEIPANQVTMLEVVLERE